MERKDKQFYYELFLTNILILWDALRIGVLTLEIEHMKISSSSVEVRLKNRKIQFILLVSNVSFHNSASELWLSANSIYSIIIKYFLQKFITNATSHPITFSQAWCSLQLIFLAPFQKWVKFDHESMFCVPCSGQLKVSLIYWSQAIYELLSPLYETLFLLYPSWKLIFILCNSRKQGPGNFLFPWLFLTKNIMDWHTSPCDSGINPWHFKQIQCWTQNIQYNLYVKIWSAKSIWSLIPQSAYNVSEITWSI